MPNAIGGAESMSPSMMGSLAESFKPKVVSPWAVWIAVLCCLGAGSFDSIAAKWMNMQYLPPCAGCAPSYFEAPFLQTFVMYIGEALCFIVFWVDDLIAKHRGCPRALDLPSAESMHKPKSPLWVWCLPTCIDFVCSTMINYAVVFALASTVQMLRNFNIVITAILTVLYIRRPLFVSHWVGVVIITCGMVLTSLYAILNPDTDNNFDSSLSYLGIILAIVGTIGSSFQFVLEEALLRKYTMPPLKAVGFEGCTGMVISAVALVVVQYAGWEDVKGSFYQMGHDETLCWATAMYCIMITGFNAAGLTVTKLGSGLLRSVIVAARSVTIWIVELAIGWNTFDGLDFAGLIVITIGVLVYGNVYPSRWCPKFAEKMHKPVPCGKLTPTLLNQEQEEELLEDHEKEAAGDVELARMEIQNSHTTASDIVEKIELLESDHAALVVTELSSTVADREPEPQTSESAKSTQ